MCSTVLVPDGKPVIGPVPGLMNVIIATGHEGGGLSMVISVSPFSTEEKWLGVFPFLFFFPLLKINSGFKFDHIFLVLN